MADEPMVQGLVWLGTRTDRYAETVAFFRDALDLPLETERTDFAAFRLPDGAVVEVFGPSDTDHTHFGDRPVTGFRVADVGGARARIEAAGGTFLAPTGDDGAGTRWAHFTGPDGNVYEITSTAG